MMTLASWLDRAKKNWKAQQRRRILQFLSLFTVCLVVVAGCNGKPGSRTKAPVSGNQADRITLGTTLTARTL